MGAAMLPPIAVTMGEPAGIGLEVAIKAWCRRTARGLPPFFLLADAGLVRTLANRLSEPVVLTEIAAPAEAAAAFADGLPVLPVPLGAPVTFGAPDPRNAEAVLSAIRQAVGFCQDGSASAVVTGPIQKATLYAAGFHHPGHTEFIAELSQATRAPVMLLTCPGLRAVPVTIHQPLRAAIAGLSTAAIVDCARTTADVLRADFGIARPRLAVAGLNPHAGEGGNLGDEEIRIVAPAVAQLQADGLAVQGPLSADTMFSAQMRPRYDAAICLYHDQALIPIKTLLFEASVNITLGLPVVRTSPDHGTALDLAGKGLADAGSMIAAIVQAGLIARHRRRAA